MKIDFIIHYEDGENRILEQKRNEMKKGKHVDADKGKRKVLQSPVVGSLCLKDGEQKAMGREMMTGILSGSLI
jgi:hypothetical protein